MTNFEFAILVFIHQNGSAAWSEVLRHFPVDQIRDVDRTLVKLLDQDRFLEKTLPYDRNRHCRLRLTQQGFHAFCVKAEQLRKEESDRQEQVRKEQAAKDERNRMLEAEAARNAKEKRSDRRFHLMLALLQAILSFVTGILVEHFTGIVGLVMEFFG